jgi:hypothetical protein
MFVLLGGLAASAVDVVDSSRCVLIVHRHILGDFCDELLLIHAGHCHAATDPSITYTAGDFPNELPFIHARPAGQTIVASDTVTAISFKRDAILAIASRFQGRPSHVP